MKACLDALDVLRVTWMRLKIGQLIAAKVRRIGRIARLLLLTYALAMLFVIGTLRSTYGCWALTFWHLRARIHAPSLSLECLYFQTFLCHMAGTIV